MENNRLSSKTPQAPRERASRSFSGVYSVIAATIIAILAGCKDDGSDLPPAALLALESFQADIALSTSNAIALPAGVSQVTSRDVLVSAQLANVTSRTVYTVLARLYGQDGRDDQLSGGSDDRLWDFDVTRDTPVRIPENIEPLSKEDGDITIRQNGIGNDQMELSRRGDEFIRYTRGDRELVERDIATGDANVFIADGHINVEFNLDTLRFEGYNVTNPITGESTQLIDRTTRFQRVNGRRIYSIDLWRREANGSNGQFVGSLVIFLNQNGTLETTVNDQGLTVKRTESADTVIYEPTEAPEPTVDLSLAPTPQEAPVPDVAYNNAHANNVTVVGTDTRYRLQRFTDATGTLERYIARVTLTNLPGPTTEIDEIRITRGTNTLARITTLFGNPLPGQTGIVNGQEPGVAILDRLRRGDVVEFLAGGQVLGSVSAE